MCCDLHTYGQTTALWNYEESNKNYKANLQICPSNHVVQCAKHLSPVQCSSIQYSVGDLSDSQESHQYWLPMEGSRILPTRNLHLLQLLSSHKLQPRNLTHITWLTCPKILAVRDVIRSATLNKTPKGGNRS